jgi:hypothetical protein
MLVAIFMTTTNQPIAPPADYTPAALTVTGTLIAAAFTSVISQYFFAPWLEVRKAILIEEAHKRAAVAKQIRTLLRALGQLQLVRTAFTGTRRFNTHWDKAMLDYNHALDEMLEAEATFTGISVKKPTANLLTATGWVAQVVLARRTPDKAPVVEAIKVVNHLIKSIDPTTFPPKRMWHTWRGLVLYKKILKPIEHVEFGN